MNKARSILNAAFALAVLFNAASYFFLPENVAIHFGRGGVPDSWMSRGASILFVTGLTILIWAGFLVSPRILEDTPAKYISLPNRDYWLREENRKEAVRKMGVLMHSFGIATAVLFWTGRIQRWTGSRSATGSI